MKIFAMDDSKRTIDSEDYKKSCMNYQFNMLENRLTTIRKSNTAYCMDRRKEKTMAKRKTSRIFI